MVSVSSERKALYEQLDAVIAQWKDVQGGLIPIMQEAQNIIGCLDEEVQNYISEAINVPVSDIYGVATFYSLFALEPKGKYVISVCLGTACYVRGAQQVLDELEKQLGVASGKTTPDGVFTLDVARCIGCCGLAPAIMINGEVHGKVTKDDVAGILSEYRSKA